MVSWFQSYLVVVSTVPIVHSAESTSPQSPINAPYSQLLGGSQSLGTVLTVYDLKTKYVAYRSSFGQEVFDARRGVDVGEGILHIISGKTDILVVTKSNRVSLNTLST